MTPLDTKLVGCYIVPKPGDEGPMFDVTKRHGVQCRLEGYAIVPLDEYERLVGHSVRVDPWVPAR